MSPAFADFLDGVEEFRRFKGSDLSRRRIGHDSVPYGPLVHLAKHRIEDRLSVRPVLADVHNFIVKDRPFRVDKGAVGDFVSDADIFAGYDVRSREGAQDLPLRRHGALGDFGLFIVDVDCENDVFDVDAEPGREDEFRSAPKLRKDPFDGIAVAAGENFLLRKEFIGEDGNSPAPDLAQARTQRVRFGTEFREGRLERRFFLLQSRLFVPDAFEVRTRVFEFRRHRCKTFFDVLKLRLLRGQHLFAFHQFERRQFSFVAA